MLNGGKNIGRARMAGTSIRTGLAHLRRFFLRDDGRIIQRRVLSVIGCIGALLGGVASLMFADYYTAEIVFVPQRGADTVSSALLLRAGIAAADIPAPTDSLNPTLILFALLSSRGVREPIAEHFSLREIYGLSTREQAQAQLLRLTSIHAQRSGIVRLRVNDVDPRRAAAIANAYAIAVARSADRIVAASSYQQSVQYQQQRDAARARRESAERVVEGIMVSTGMTWPDLQLRDEISRRAMARASVVAKELQIQAMGLHLTPESSTIQRQREQLGRWKLDLDGADGVGRVDENSSTGRMDNRRDHALELMRSAARDLVYFQTLEAILESSHELAAFRTANGSSVFQVLDPAVEPDKPAGPRRWTFAFGGAVLFVLAALLTGFVARAVSRNCAGRTPWSR